MKTLILIVAGFLFMVTITGCSDNVRFGDYKTSSSGNGNQEDNSDGFDGSVDLNDPAYSHIRRQTTNLQVIHPKNKVDILFVVDNSSSMKLEQEKISQRFDNFIDQIGDLDWRIGITTTDPNSYRNGGGNWWGDGQLIPLGQGRYHLNSSMNLGMAQRLFSRNIKRDEKGSDVEKGIYATYRTLERYVNPRTEVDFQIRQFLRWDSSLAVVVISDEDESPGSEADCSNGCRGVLYDRRSDPDNLIGHVKKVFGPDKIFQFHSIIAHTRACLNGTGHTYGYRYGELSEKTGGVVGNVCSNDYSGILSSIGERVFRLQRTYKLDCTPLDANNNGVFDMKIIAKDPSLKIPDYAISGDYITFHGDLSQGEYELTYHCFK